MSSSHLGNGSIMVLCPLDMFQCINCGPMITHVHAGGLVDLLLTGHVIHKTDLKRAFVACFLYREAFLGKVMKTKVQLAHQGLIL